MGNEWFYSREGTQCGPVSVEALKGLVQQGTVARDTLVWKEGMPSWTPAGQVAELFAAPPPLPAAQPTRSAPPPLPPPQITPIKAPARRNTRLAFEDGDSKPARPSTAAASSPPPLPAPQAKPTIPNQPTVQWFYEIQGKRVGPLDEGAMASLIRSGVVVGATRVWHAALPDWTPAAQTHLVAHIPADQPPPLTPGSGPSVESPAGVYIEKRDPMLVGVLSTVTLGLYAIYLVYLWSRELNALHRREKYPPTVVLVLSILTFGLAGMLFECAYALDLDKLTKRFNVPDRAGNLGGLVICLNVIGWILAFASLGALLLIGLLLCVAATCLVQKEMNKLADCVVGGEGSVPPPIHAPTTTPTEPSPKSPRSRPFAVKNNKKTLLWGCGAALTLFVLVIAMAIPNVLRSRMAANESAAIAWCRLYYEAQLKFAEWDYDQDGQLEYAQRITGIDSLYESMPGAADRLLVTDEIANASRPATDPQREPYKGYFIKTLSGQGPKAKRGPRNYVVGQNQIEGFALLAYPAEYDKTGKMSYVIGPDGIVYGKDLGLTTSTSAEVMTLYNPDSTWTQEYP